MNTVDGNDQPEAGTTDEQDLADRGSNRSQRPQSQAFRDFMATGWAERNAPAAQREAVADFTPARRDKLSSLFPGERLVIPAGPLKVRSNDTDYRFRPHSAFAHLTGLGTDEEPDAVLVMHPQEDGSHESVLYFRPLAPRDSEEFYADARYGEFWVGARPTLEDLETRTGLRCAHIDELSDALAKDTPSTHLRVVREADEALTAVIDSLRGSEDVAADDHLAEEVSQLRLVKDGWEIDQLREAVRVTIDGFADVAASLERASKSARGERVIEGAFGARAREEGNGIGYDTIAAAGNHATTLHWIRNNGTVGADELVLVDAGVEVDSLYTADVTRTLPVSGKFSPIQRKIYEAVLAAADAAFEFAKPGVLFRDIHTTALRVLAEKLDEWGLLPVSVEEACSPEGSQHRRWMPHGTSHHLGLDVHDCAQARRAMYLDAELEEGMVFTIEPGLYFKEDDLAVPAEYRGIGVRIEDDILVTATGVENLSVALPRTVDEVEAWMAKHQ